MLTPNLWEYVNTSYSFFFMWFSFPEHLDREKDIDKGMKRSKKE